MQSFVKSALIVLLAGTALPTTASAQEAATPPSVEAPSESSLAVARQIIDLGFPESSREDMFFASMDQMMAQTREATFKAYGLEDEGAITILDQWIADYTEDSKAVLRSHIPSLMDGMATSYAVIFTQQELEDVLGFVSTPSGQRFFQLSAAVMAEPNFAQANQAYMNETQAMLPGAMKELVGQLQTYMKEQQAAAEQVQS